MSGICGLARVDGGAIDGGRLERMTSWLERRGPDARATWADGPAGFGHTLLDTTDGQVADAQPCTLDGRQWIVADARIDSRAELVSSLEGAGERIEPAATDAQLILHAWRAWGEDCAARLAGDFAFAIWDRERRSLHCARDPLGVKPFFHTLDAGTFVFSNTLACLLSEPALSHEIDESAIADFLLFEMPQDPGATVFKAVRRLAPAHCLTLSPGGLRIRRYWQLTPAELPTARRGADYVEEFDELMERAVADRVRSGRVSILLSGGLDSSALAAIAARRGIDVKGFSSVFDRIVPDDERHYSTLAARSIGIPIQHRACDGYGLFERYPQLAFHFPEPANAPFAAADIDLAADAAGHARVALTGWDGDALLAESPRPYFAALAARGHWPRLAASLTRFVLDHPASAARSAWLRVARRAQPPHHASCFPPWLNEDFAARMRLHERWRDALHAPSRPDAIRPTAHRTLEFIARLGNFFEATEAARTGLALEMRHPFFDVRVIRFCLSLPPVPWCIRKEILRRWLRGRVDEAVRTRPKTPLGGFPHVTAPDPLALRREAPALCEEAARFIDRGKMAATSCETDPARTWANLRPVALDLWFRHGRSGWFAARMNA